MELPWKPRNRTAETENFKCIGFFTPRLLCFLIEFWESLIVFVFLKHYLKFVVYNLKRWFKSHLNQEKKDLSYKSKILKMWFVQTDSFFEYILKEWRKKTDLTQYCPVFIITSLEKMFVSETKRAKTLLSTQRFYQAGVEKNIIQERCKIWQVTIQSINYKVFTATKRVNNQATGGIGLATASVWRTGEERERAGRQKRRDVNRFTWGLWSERATKQWRRRP